MLFTSCTFLVFFVLTFVLFWFLNGKSLKLRNLFLLCASYTFYGWWDWRFLSLIILSSATDYLIAAKIAKSETTQRVKKSLLTTSLTVNLGLLFTFKYFNFFSESLVNAFYMIGIELSPLTLQVILPVGISFYTFQTLSYTIDVYRNRLQPSKDWVTFFTFVTFFPQLVAGPIERAVNLLPQIEKKCTFTTHDSFNALRLILWGLFQKAYIADNLAPHVNYIFNNHSTLSPSVLALGLIYFSFQIYGDFAGYSNIARGTALLLGFKLMKNFSTPYFSRDISEFWRRWHISLSTWFRDYLYIPLGGNQCTKTRAIRNIFIVFLVSGFWHGANWTFIIWGLIHASLYLPIFIQNKHRKNTNTLCPGKLLPSVKEALQIFLTFSIVCLAWTFFRAENTTHAFQYLTGMTNLSIFSLPNTQRSGIVIVGLFLLIEWFDRDSEIPLCFPRLKRPFRHIIYMILCSLLYYRGYFGEQDFIYFQF